MTTTTPLPTLAELRERAHVLSLPMNVSFRGITHREVVLLRGTHAWAEWAPFVEYDDAESARWLRAGLHWGFTPLADAAIAGPEVAVNATVPAVDVRADGGAAALDAVLRRYPGCRTVKIKVGDPGRPLAATVEEDCARIAAVLAWYRAAGEAGDAAGAGSAGSAGSGPAGAGEAPPVRVRLDANGAWDAAETVEMLMLASDIEGFRAALDYVEQPVPTLEGLRELRELWERRNPQEPLRIAADEVIRKAADPVAAAIAAMEVCDAMVLKVAPLGGVDRLVAVADAVSAACGREVPVTVSSAIDSGVGIVAGATAAAMLGPRAAAAGLATGTMFRADVARHPIVDGMLRTSVVEPGEAALAELAAPAERQRWWMERLERCYAELCRAEERGGAAGGAAVWDAQGWDAEGRKG